tara:strand:+ start:1046 stop:3079 length:2034 start_codon:yes stop_codon:yes gene_type:complete
MNLPFFFKNLIRKNAVFFNSLLIILFLVASCQTSKQKKLILSKLFSNHMVLQQNEEVAFWGTYKPNKKITVSGSWNQKSVMCMSDKNGFWKLNLPTTNAGGPYDITIVSLDSIVVLSDVLIGEVWLASGQSNMEMPLGGWPPGDSIKNSKQEIINANHPTIRMFNVKRNFTKKPIDTISGKWSICTPTSVVDFSATAYFFARRLQKELNVPIGIIHSSWGGTVAEAWTSKKPLNEFKNFETPIAALEDPTLFQSTKNWYSKFDTVSLPQTSKTWDSLNFQDLEFSEYEFNDEKWKQLVLPSRYDKFDGWEFDGAIWFRKNIELSDVSTDYTLSLGVIDDMDFVYFNGVKIGGLAGYGHHTTKRTYTVSKKLIKKGTNTIAIRVIDTGGPGIINGTLKLSNQNNFSISLNGLWKYQPIAELYNGKFYYYDIDKIDFANRPNIISMGPNLPTVLFNAMINPLKPYNIKGAIWYQGESNVGRAEEYAHLFPKMISDWRSHWNKEFPFYFVQIAPYNYGTQLNEEGSMDLRDAQRKSLKTKNTGMVVTMDIGNFSNIHPANKQDVGGRLAGLALVNDYHKEIIASGPMFEGQRISKNKLILTFTHIGSGLTNLNSKLKGFEIAGIDEKYVPAIAEIKNNTVHLSALSIKAPKYARYAWSDNGIATLFNKEGLPASSFKTKD